MLACVQGNELGPDSLIKKDCLGMTIVSVFIFLESVVKP